MGVGTGKEHILGRTQKFYANTEATMGTFVKPEAADALRVTQSSIKFEPSREPYGETSIYADEVEMVTGKSKVSWSVDADLRPSGTAATAPEAAQLLTAALGTQTFHSSTHYDWSLSSDQTTIPTLSITRWHGESVGMQMDTIWGAWVGKMSVKLAGGSKPTIHFEGGAMGYVNTGATVLSGAMVTTDQMEIAAANAGLIGINSVVQVAALTNTGAGYKVTAGTASPYTLESAISADNAAVVQPYVPTPTYLGSPITGLLGSLTMAGTTLPITAFDLDLDNNFEVCEDHHGTTFADDLIRQKRKITGNITARVRRDLMPLWMTPREGYSTVALVVACGTVAGSRFTFNVPYAELNWSEMSHSGDKASTIQIPFRALATSAGNNSLTVVHD